MGQKITILKSYQMAFISLLFIVATYLTISFTLAKMDTTNGMILHVNAIDKYAKRNSITLSQGSWFISGTEGTLTWKPKTLTEALILGTNRGIMGMGIDMFHTLILCLYLFVLYFMISSSNNNRFFTSKTIYGYYFFAFLIGISGGLELLRYALVNNYFRDITHNQFSLSIPDFPIMYFSALGTFFFILTRLPQKGLELQQQQELTI